MEWKFHRTKLWMSYFDEGSSLPPPFNTIITPKSCWYFVKKSFNCVRWCFCRYQWRPRSKRATIRVPRLLLLPLSLSSPSPTSLPPSRPP